MALATANYAVAALNAVAATASLDLRDMLAFVAWTGSGTYWMWQAMSAHRQKDGDRR